MPVETMVQVKASILCGDDSVLEIGRDLIERYKFVAFVIRRAVDPALQATLDLHRGCRWVDPPDGYEHQHGKQPKKRCTDAKPSNIEDRRALAGCGWTFGHISE